MYLKKYIDFSDLERWKSIQRSATIIVRWGKTYANLENFWLSDKQLSFAKKLSSGKAGHLLLDTLLPTCTHKPNNITSCLFSNKWKIPSICFPLWNGIKHIQSWVKQRCILLLKNHGARPMTL